MHQQEEETNEKQRKKKEIIDQLAASTQTAAKILEIIENEDTADITQKVTEPDVVEQLDDNANRGPSLTQRLEQYKLNMARIQEAEKSTINPFEHVLTSEFKRSETPLILPIYVHPCIEASFEAVKYKAGGYSQRQVYKKALESLYLSIEV